KAFECQSPITIAVLAISSLLSTFRRDGQYSNCDGALTFKCLRASAPVIPGLIAASSGGQRGSRMCGTEIIRTGSALGCSFVISVEGKGSSKIFRLCVFQKAL